MRRRGYRSPLVLASLLIATGPLAAQETLPSTATPSVQGYLCTFAGKCDGAEAPLVTRDAPATRGFRLARPTAERAEAPVAVPAVQPRAARAVRGARPGQPAYGRRAPVRAPAMAAVPAYGAAPTPVTAAAPGRGRADLLIGFRLNSAELTADGRSAAQVFARAMQAPELSAKRFVIEGHTDLRGGAALNTALSARRAQTVADYLVSQGVARGRLEARGFGATAPLAGHRASDPTNRRVEAALLP